MTLDALIILLGAFVALLPFLGFPNSWDDMLLLCAGILIVILGIIVRRRGIGPRMFDSREPERPLSEHTAEPSSPHDAP